MKTAKQYFVKLISYFNALLFIYAAASKWMDFENFRIQLGQSTLLSAYAEVVSILVPLLEFAIAFMLLVPRYRFIGMLSALSLMAVFSAYIYLILNYSSYVPCSCGGVLESMSWHQHLAFNIAIVLADALAVIAIAPYKTDSGTFARYHSLKSKLLMMTASCILGTAGLFFLFRSSEKIIHYQNTLQRRFPPHAAQEEYRIDLKFNSYYFAGAGSGKIYLGNHTTPLIITELDTASRTLNNKKIILGERNVAFKTPQVKVKGSHFFLYEGTIPYIFSGSTLNWTASLNQESGSYFSQLEPIDSSNVAVRFLDAATGENLLGTIDLSANGKEKTESRLLKKQIDGIFDTDGQLHYNTEMASIIYVYRYRNQFINSDRNLNLGYVGKTIDTVSKAQIALKQVRSRNYKTFSEPPMVVNRMSTTYSTLLFVNSTIPGKYDDDYLWKNSSIIDVYDLPSKTYRSSFPIYHIGTSKMKSFIAYGTKIYALTGSHLVCYSLLPHLDGGPRN